MTAIGAPDWIGSPSFTDSVSITPALCAVISFSIFIASMMQMSWPSSTVCALLDEHLPHVALQRRDELVGAAARRRWSARRAAAWRAAGAAAAPFAAAGA